MTSDLADRLVERIARIIDPAGWATRDRQMKELARMWARGDAVPDGAEQGPPHYTRESLSKAREILSLDALRSEGWRPIEIEPTGREHELKTWPGPYEAMEDGRKPFEYRKNDRDYREGDVLRCRKWSPVSGDYTGDELRRLVTYVLGERTFGVPAGYAVLGLRPLPPPPSSQEREDHE